MSRRGRRGTDGAQGEGAWLPEEYGDDREYPADGRGGHARQRPGAAGPPWETGGWEVDTGSWQAVPEPPDQDWQGHPSGPLPSAQGGQHPSGPLPPLPSPGWQDGQHGDWQQPGPPGADDYPAAPGSQYPRQDYPSGAYAAGDYPTGLYPGDPGSGAFAPPGEYQTGGFPAAGYPSGSFPAGSYQGGEYRTGDYPAGDYATGGYPAAADYAGSGFGEPTYQQDYDAQGFQPDEPDEPDGQNGYPPQRSRRYRDEGAGPGYSGADPGNHPGYPDRGGWYGDVDEQQLWTDEDEAGSGFLPGLGEEGQERRDGGRAGRGRPAGRPGQRKRGGLRRIMPRVFLGLLLAMVLAAGGYGYYLWRSYFHPPDYSGPGTGSVVVHVQSGETATAIGEELQRLGVVASARAFGNAAKASPQGNALEPGFYRLHKHMQAALAFTLLLKPSSRVMYKVVIPEGLRLSQIIATLGKATGNLAGYKAAIKNVPALGLPAYANGKPEGYLFPATYTIQPGTPPLQVLQEMVQRFKQEAVSANLAAVARQHQISEHNVIVTASLIQAEGGRLQDFPKIARVIYNRLFVVPMQLELDSTVMYALNTYGIIANNQQLQVNSPYNTYRHFGLPPGPIDSPGDAAIKAALHPAPGNWLYFVTVDPKTGLTKFTNDPAVFAQLRNELQQNVAHGK